ncbi:class I SAM-dependent methyltransferase [Haloferula chungangensis]|uniref:Class I SAM-dependent methyltransferase n=1 Tax=Haloferula chungangensis TaxID=1048331 RepID=A0ABW2L5R5_9BACT
MLPAKPFSYPGIDGDIARLSKLLAIGLQTATWNPPESPAILNLACGRADETGTLLSHLAPTASRLFYLGIDLRAPEINEARSRWIPTAPLGWDLDFRVGDASRTDRMKQLPPFDFIFIRHQNFWNDAPIWTDLYANALAALKPNGLLAITSYFDREHALATACLKQLGAELLTSIRHPESRPLTDAPGKSVDRHLAIFKR